MARKQATFLLVREAPSSTSLGIPVSDGPFKRAAGLEPATFGLETHCSTN